MTSLNLFCCKSCFSLGGLLLGLGILLMISCPRQLAPTIVPTFPENPPRIPFVIRAILFNLLVDKTKVKQNIQAYITPENNDSF